MRVNGAVQERRVCEVCCELGLLTRTPSPTQHTRTRKGMHTRTRTHPALEHAMSQAQAVYCFKEVCTRTCERYYGDRVRPPHTHVPTRMHTPSYTHAHSKTRMPALALQTKRFKWCTRT